MRVAGRLPGEQSPPFAEARTRKADTEAWGLMGFGAVKLHKRLGLQCRQRGTVTGHGHDQAVASSAL